MESKIKLISPKLQKHSNSLPIKSNNIQRISSYKSHSPVPTKISNNFSSIETVTEFPFINETKNSKIINKIILDEHYSPRENKAKKQVIFINNNVFTAQKLVVQNYELSTQSKSVFDAVKQLSEKKK
jgi:hypothetical protein